MSGGQEMTRNLLEQEPGQKNRHANAADKLNIAQGNARAKRAGTYHITPEGGETFTIYAKGREAWALDRLRWAGAKGVTPIEQPAPRWSAYIHILRERGLPIETIYEPHGGEFSGTHGRYVLRADVRKGGGE